MLSTPSRRSGTASRPAAVSRRRRGRGGAALPLHRHERSAAPSPQPLEHRGERLAPGTPLLLSLWGADHDGAAFPASRDASTSPPTSDAPHVAFGRCAPHHCLGAALARAELCRTASPRWQRRVHHLPRRSGPGAAWKPSRRPPSTSSSRRAFAARSISAINGSYWIGVLLGARIERLAAQPAASCRASRSAGGWRSASARSSGCAILLVRRHVPESPALVADARPSSAKPPASSTRIERPVRTAPPDSPAPAHAIRHPRQRHRRTPARRPRPPHEAPRRVAARPGTDDRPRRSSTTRSSSPTAWCSIASTACPRSTSGST